MIISPHTTIKELLLKDKISRRTYNICYYHNLLRVDSVKEFYDTHGTFMLMRNCGMKTNHELLSVIADISEETNIEEEIRDLNDTEEEVSDTAKNAVRTSNPYTVALPFLMEDEIQFVVDFLENNGHFPMFHMATKILMRSARKHHSVFCQRYGLGMFAETQDFVEIAKSRGLSRERVRQIFREPVFRKEPIVNFIDWQSYVENNEVLFITANSDFYKQILLTEKIDIPFGAFAQILISVLPYDYDVQAGIEYLVVPKYKYSVREIICMLTRLKTESFSDTTLFTLNDIFGSKKIMGDPILLNLILSDIAPLLGISTEGEYLVFEQNCIDIAEDVYNHLYSIGEPVHIDALLAFLATRYPTEQFTIAKIKYEIAKSSEISPIGKTSMYKLRHWRNVFGGTIRDLLRETLENSPIPMHIDDLVDKVTDVFVSTNKKNVHASLSGSEEFTPFAGSLWGLTLKAYPIEYVKVNLSRAHASFDERFMQYKNFVDECNRLPYCSGIEEEDKLKRWQINVTKCIIEVSDEQVRQLEDYMASKSELPSSGREYVFYQNCREYIDFVKSNFELPTIVQNKILHYWFNRNLNGYREYNDNRKPFFQNLLNELKSYGFYF